MDCSSKVKFATEDAAKVSVSKLLKKHKEFNYRVYLCDCGLWHISTKPKNTNSQLAEANKKLQDKVDQLKKRNTNLAKEIVSLRQSISELILKNLTINNETV